jgi:hypothetical protein
MLAQEKKTRFLIRFKKLRSIFIPSPPNTSQRIFPALIPRNVFLGPIFRHVATI